MEEKIKWALNNNSNDLIHWAEPSYYRELKQDPIYDECFLQAISESDMDNCHQQYLKDYIAGEREKMRFRCCTAHTTMFYIQKRAFELYEEKMKNGNTQI